MWTESGRKTYSETEAMLDQTGPGPALTLDNMAITV